MNLTQNQIAYIAGFLEGDGSFQIMKYRSKKQGYVYEYRISAYNTKPEVIIWFHKNIGGYYSEIKTSTRNKKPYHWHIKNQESIKLAEIIFPYLVGKKEEVSIWIEYAKSINPNNTQKRSEEIINYRNDLIEKIRKIRFTDNIVTKTQCQINSSISKENSISEQHFSYLAGLVDSEGCFRLHRINKKNRPNAIYSTVLEISNTNILFSEWLMRFGGNIIFRKSIKDKNRNQALWYIMASQLRSIIKYLYKYLIIKKPVCEKIIEFDSTFLNNGGDRHSEIFRNSYRSIIEKRNIIFDQIQSLNAKGHY